MNNPRMIIFVMFLGLMIPTAMAETPKEEDFMRDLEKIRNPFLSYLLKKQETPPAPPRVVVQTPQPPKPAPQPPAVFKPSFPQPVVKEDGKFLEGLKINGIIWDTDMPQAIISDHVVKVGDLVNGDKVTFIDKKGVEISHNGLKYLLTVSGSKTAATQVKP